jgi:hypothetical protein
VGNAFTVTELLTELLQVPLLYVYFTETVPEVNPVTTPPVLTDAVPVPATIDQVPPDCALVKAAVVALTQTVAVPLALADKVGNALTVNELTTELLQVPLLYVYLTETVPAVNPVTTPPELTDAVPVPATIDQVPPDCALVNAGVVAFTQTVDAPPPLAAKAGNAFIVALKFVPVLTHPLAFFTVRVPG